MQIEAVHYNPDVEPGTSTKEVIFEGNIPELIIKVPGGQLELLQKDGSIYVFGDHLIIELRGKNVIALRLEE